MKALRGFVLALLLALCLGAPSLADYHLYSTHVTWTTETDAEKTKFRLYNLRTNYTFYGENLPTRFVPGVYEGGVFTALGTTTYPGSWNGVAGTNNYSTTASVDFIPLLRAAGKAPGTYEVGFAFQDNGGYGYANRAVCTVTLALPAPPPEPEPEPEAADYAAVVAELQKLHTAQQWSFMALCAVVFFSAVKALRRA